MSLIRICDSSVSSFLFSLRLSVYSSIYLNFKVFLESLSVVSPSSLFIYLFTFAIFSVILFSSDEINYIGII